MVLYVENELRGKSDEEYEYCMNMFRGSEIEKQIRNFNIYLECIKEAYGYGLVTKLSFQEPCEYYDYDKFCSTGYLIQIKIISRTLCGCRTYLGTKSIYSNIENLDLHKGLSLDEVYMDILNISTTDIFDINAYSNMVLGNDTHIKLYKRKMIITKLMENGKI